MNVIVVRWRTKNCTGGEYTFDEARRIAANFASCRCCCGSLSVSLRKDKRGSTGKGNFPSRISLAYLFSPTKKWIASVLVLVLLIGADVTAVTTPIAFSTPANASAAGNNLSRLSGFISIDTFDTLATLYKCGFI
jgi:hypothetical protein